MVTKTKPPTAVWGIAPEAGPAWAELRRVLLDHGPPPCSTNPDAWTSETGADRAEAAQACRWCHARPACAAFAAANGEPGGVWGGTDRTPTPTPTPRRSHARK